MPKNPRSINRVGKAFQPHEKKILFENSRINREKMCRLLSKCGSGESFQNTFYIGNVQTNFALYKVAKSHTECRKVVYTRRATNQQKKKSCSTLNRNCVYSFSVLFFFLSAVIAFSFTRFGCSFLSITRRKKILFHLICTHTHT